MPYEQLLARGLIQSCAHDQGRQVEATGQGCAGCPIDKLSHGRPLSQSAHQQGAILCKRAATRFGLQSVSQGAHFVAAPDGNYVRMRDPITTSKHWHWQCVAVAQARL